MNNWVAGTNFEKHFVGYEDPTDQVVIRGEQVYALPRDYTMLDQLFDEEAVLTLIPEEIMRRVRTSLTYIGESAARKVVIIDNTVEPPALKQVPLDDGNLTLSRSVAEGLSLSKHSMEEIHG